MPRKVDLNTSELLQMRENGMSNDEIAAAVGVNRNTIYRYIGPQGGQPTRHAYDPEKKKKKKKEEPEAHLSVQNKSIELHGRYGAYVVDCKEKNIMVSLAKTETDEDVFDIPFEHLDELINELQAIQRKVSELHIGAEMW